MLDREGVTNRINNIIKEFDKHGNSRNLSSCAVDILIVLQNHNMRELKYEELLNYHGIPVWLETAPQWLEIDADFNEIKKWIIPQVFNGILAKNREVPLYFQKSNYGEYWKCYERTL